MSTTATSTTSTFSAPDISCGGCANAIRRALGSLPDIHDIAVDVEAKTVTLTQDESGDPQTILAALDRAGFPATQIKNPAAPPKPVADSCSCCSG
jgi:copper chaperone CopZ